VEWSCSFNYQHGGSDQAVPELPPVLLDTDTHLDLSVADLCARESTAQIPI
jgi:hypothetical protein